MNYLNSIISNTVARGLTELVNRAGGAVFWVMVARYLGISGLGTLAYALSLFSLFSTLSSMGLGNVAVRDIAKDKTKAGVYFGQGLLLGLGLSLLFAGLMITTSLVLKPGEYSIFASIAMAIAIFPASGFYWSKTMLSAAEKMGYIAIARALENSFKVIVGLIMILAGAGIKELVLVIVFSKVISFAVCFAFASDKVARPVWRSDKEVLGHLIKHAPSFSLINLFNSLFWSISVLLLTSLRGEAEAGIFSAAFKLVEICIALALAYGQAFFPVISRISRSERELFQQLFQKSIKFITIATLAVAGIMQVIAPQLITLFYGPGMDRAVPVLQVLIWLIVPFGIIPVMAFTLISINQQKFDLVANISGTMILFVTSMIIVPVSGALGAAISIVIAGFVFLAAELFGLSSKFYRLQNAVEWLKPLPGLLLMWSIAFILKDYQVWLAMFSGAVMYVIYLWLSKTVTQPEILYLKKWVSVR